MQIKWNKNKIDNIVSFDGIAPEVRDIFLESFEKQKSIEGNRFPRKKFPEKAGSSLFLKDTGQMIDSLRVIFNERTNTLLITLEEKSEIYRDFLHWRTNWLSVSTKLGDKILRAMKIRNNKKRK